MLKDWKIEALTGYKPRANFYLEFSMAEPFGISAIANTYNRIFAKSKDSVGYITELSMAVNWKVYEHCDKNVSYAKFYQSIWEQVDNYCNQSLKGINLEYYQRHIAEYCSW